VEPLRPVGLRIAGRRPTGATAGPSGQAEEGWRRALADAPFEQLREVRLPYERELPRAVLLDYFASVSPVTALQAAERAAALKRIAAALDRPSYRRRWTVALYWTRLAG
jgi:hypothetical protein